MPEWSIQGEVEQEMTDMLKEFYGPNAGYVLALYERYLQDPQSVNPEARDLFSRWPPLDEITRRAVIPAGLPAEQPTTAEGVLPDQIAAAVRLAYALRTYGHMSAQLDPLGSPPPGDPAHMPGFHGISDEELKRIPASVIGGPVTEGIQTAFEAIQALRLIYTTRIGYDYGHVREPEEREWLRTAAECGEFRPPNAPVDPRLLLERLTEVDALEQFLHRIFPGKTRFSIEGVDMLVPMLDELLIQSAEANICTLQIGMAHRGRLNVLAHVVQMPYAQILADFRDPVKNFSTREELGWTGDVKYHKGGRHVVSIEEHVHGADETVRLLINLPPNPSHLEHINPVVTGMARAAGEDVDQPGAPVFSPDASLPILVHGDASFTGQGVVAETLNMSRLAGYTVGGAVHIITNNQLGYTTLPENERSTLYASDLAKGFEIPIIHANADDPVSCLEAVRTAFAYRQRFHKDFLIDLVGYRRYGHNEGDEPGFTQPQLYTTIDAHPRVRELWAKKLTDEDVIQPGEAERLFQERIDALQQVNTSLEAEKEIGEPLIEPPPRGLARKVDTTVPLEELKAINAATLALPDRFHLNRKLERSMKRRAAAFDDPDQASIDWATAEELALATILANGIPVRLSGEDVQRGTFSQRHAVFHDTTNGGTYTPLQALPQAKAAFEVINSPLSENAALGFEYGYNIFAPDRLVIWEAQYADFINTAQAMIDEFIFSARAKWELTPSLVLLLPHGVEGQGPDHSSGRPERFLEMAADINLRLANCTTAAQYFHLLRRQALLLKSDPLPLIVLTPKSLLRNPLVASTPRELAEGRWQPVIDDPIRKEQPEQVARLILCSGKVYIDLISSEQRQSTPEIAIARIEQLYRFPEQELRNLIEGYPHLQEVVWLQEEPQNMGAWTFVAPRLEAILGGRVPLRYIGRSDSASPAEGSSARYAILQKSIVDQAYALENVRVKEG